MYLVNGNTVHFIADGLWVELEGNFLQDSESSKHRHFTLSHPLLFPIFDSQLCVCSCWICYIALTKVDIYNVAAEKTCVYVQLTRRGHVHFSQDILWTGVLLCSVLPFYVIDYRTVKFLTETRSVISEDSETSLYVKICFLLFVFILYFIIIVSSTPLYIVSQMADVSITELTSNA